MNFNKKILASAVATLIATHTGGLFAQDIALEEVVVTAQKRAQSLQDVAVSIQALDSGKLEDLGIKSFDDYALLLPSLSFTGKGGPGTNIIYMRGSSDGGNGNTSGSQPGVSMYLDEQPVSAIGANLDIHIYDIARIEALAGPQGTLYGASSQAGTVRIITNKPDKESMYGGFDVTGSATRSGDPSYTVEGFVNIPLGDSAALRIVAWDKKEGGYIDNVAGTRTYNLDGNYGGHPIQNPTLGRTDTIDNSALVEENFNVLRKRGARASLSVDLDDNWVANINVITQSLKTEGAWDHDPANAGELQIQRFFEDKNEDDFTQASISLEGEVADHDVVFTSSVLDRDNYYQADYTAYGEQASWVPFYACDYTSTAIGTPNTDCTSLKQYNVRDNSFSRNSHELRLQSTGDGAISYVAGAFYDEDEVDYEQLFIQPGISPKYWAAGFEDNFYRTDQVRTDIQKAVFGEITYNITDDFSATFGARKFWNSSELTGFVGYADASPAVGGVGIVQVNSQVKDSDSIFKGNLTWHVTEDAMVYATVSEGYRAGGLNRDINAPNPNYASDLITNHELGWKTTWMDNRLRINGALYYMEWSDMQFSYYNVSISPVSNVYNVGAAEITGLESDITFAISNDWTISTSFNYNDAKTSTSFDLFGSQIVPDGTELPNVPEFKANVFSRYNFTVKDYDAFAQVSYAFVGSSFSSLAVAQRQVQKSYGLVNMRFGIEEEKWTAELFVNNLTDERAQLSVGQRSNYERSSVIINRPRSIGVAYKMRF